MVTPQQYISDILVLVMQLIIVLAGGCVINYLKEKLGTEKLKNYYSIVKLAVSSVEQTLGAGKGVDKKQEAFQIIKTLTKGKLKDDQIDRLIESAVFETNNLLKNNKLID